MHSQHSRRRGFTLVELMVVIGILGLLVGILAVAVMDRMGDATGKMEVVQMNHVMEAVQRATIESTNRKKFMAMKEKSGRAFWEACFKQRVLDGELLSKLVCVSSKGGDVATSSDFIEEEGGKLPEGSCSYTSPKGSDLLATMNLKGLKKTAVVTWDAKNWKNYPKKGVLVAWSEGEAPEYLEFSTAESLYEITKEEWEDPTKLYGKKRPFERTFEEKK